MRGAASVLLLALLGAAAGSARSAEILVVASEPIMPSTKEALEGVSSAFTTPIEIVSASRPLPAGPHGVIIALGGRAALRARQAGSPMVVALAPAYRSEGRGPVTVRVAMTPEPEDRKSVV